MSTPWKADNRVSDDLQQRLTDRLHEQQTQREAVEHARAKKLTRVSARRVIGGFIFETFTGDRSRIRAWMAVAIAVGLVITWTFSLPVFPLVPVLAMAVIIINPGRLIRKAIERRQHDHFR